MGCINESGCLRQLNAKILIKKLSFAYQAGAVAIYAISVYAITGTNFDHFGIPFTSELTLWARQRYWGQVIKIL
jgi:hypothetical protein